MTTLTEEQELAVLGELPSAEHPVVLLPVRLETRFVTSGATPELLVRLYPDEVHVDTHEPGLTAQEAEWGRHFWAQTWRTGTDDDDASAVARRHQAWEQLAQRYGAGRAEWIVRTLQPTNPGDRPAQPVPEGTPLPAQPVHPAHATREDTWTRAPQARALPARWVLLAHRGGRRVALASGEPLPERLAVGPDPGAPPPPQTGDDELAVDPGMRWLVDFAAAQEAGMAVRIPLTADDVRLGFDTLVAVGLRGGSTPQEATVEVAALLDAHRYTEGLAVSPLGTPTNNTEAGAAGRASRSLDPVATYPLGRDGDGDGDAPDAGSAQDTAGPLLAAALGVDRRALAPVVGAGTREQADARAMQALLWPGTGGYFLEHLLDVFPAEDLARVRQHFLDHVRAEGPLPTLRLGRQPYGVLPVTSLERWPADGGARADLLRTLRQRWRAAIPRVPRLDRRPTATVAPSEAAILNVLRSGPTSAGYGVRLALDHRLFGVRELHTRFELPSQVTLHEQNLRTFLTGLGLPGLPRLLSTVLAADSADLRDDAVLAPQGAPADDAELLRWLRESPPETIRLEQGLPARPGHLLYLVARHAVLLTYASVAREILRAAGAPEGATGDPAVVDVLEADTLTLGRLAARPLPGLAKPLHELTAADHPAAALLDEMRSALDYLRALPPDRLEALLTGTLDLFAYRLDAWVTSLATGRLRELRANNPVGAVVGGFGWLEDVRASPPRPPAPVTPEEAGPLVVDPMSAGFVHAPSLNQASTAALLRSGYAGVGGEPGASHPFAVDLSSQRVRLAEWLLDGVRQGQPLGALLGYRFERGLHDRALDGYIAIFRRLAPFGELARAQVAAEEAEEAAQRLRGLKHPDLAKANTALTAAKTKHTQLTQERSRLPGRLATAERALAPLLQQRTALIAEIQRIGNLLRRQPLNERLNEQLLEANLKMRRLTPRIEKLQADIKRIKDRQAVINGLVTTAARDVTAAQRRVNELRNLPHPGLAAAEQAAGTAKAEYDGLLAEARRQRLYPPTASVEALEAVEVLHVVDGLALLDLHERGAVPFGLKGLPAPRHPHHPLLVAELAALEAAVDAVRDALTAESVHQVVQGNPTRAGASLDAVARREVPPPELEFHRTPRSGVAVAHRVVVVGNASDDAVPAWPTDARQVRAAVEPMLHRWVAALLGDPAAIRCDVLFEDEVSGEVLARRDLRLRNAGLAPLDLVALADATGAARPELMAYLADRSRATRPPDVPADAPVRVLLDRQADWPADVRSLAEALEVARAVGEVLAGGRALAPGDLALPEEEPTAAVDLAELAARADAAVRRLAVAHAALERVLPPAGVADAGEGDAPAGGVAGLDAAGVEAVGKGLVQMLFFGFAESVPALAVGEAPGAVEDLLARARAVEEAARRRLEAARNLDAGFGRAAATPEAQVAHDTARVQAVLGRSFVVLPRLTGGPFGGASPSGAARPDLGGDPSAPATWLQRMAHVRRDVEHLQTVLLYGAVAGAAGDVEVAQLPAVEGERWVALAPPAGSAVPGGRLSLVGQVTEPLGAAGAVAGLFVDEWVEVVPSRSEVTGIACNIDEPAAQPPQAVLVAVAPPGTDRWGVDLLESILLETLELARLRAVAPEQLAPSTDLEEVLPALYFGLNLQNDTVSTDFTRAMEQGG